VEARNTRAAGPPPPNARVRFSFAHFTTPAKWLRVFAGAQVRVSFKFDDGSWMKHAFVYDWRVWPVAEMRSVMASPTLISGRERPFGSGREPSVGPQAEAGFSRTVVCVDDTDESGYSHNFAPLATQEEFEARIDGEEFYSCYIVAYTDGKSGKK